MKANLQPRIVKLGPMRVASCRVIGKEPEIAAFRMMADWEAKAGLPDNQGIRYFGFDNPAPSARDSEYGYEVWIAAGIDAKESGDIKLKDFPGGLYAVLPTRLSRIGQSWRELLAWRAESAYGAGTHQCLEEHHCLPLDNAPEAVEIDLYLPLLEQSVPETAPGL